MSMAIQKAIIYATEKHEGQKRKGTDIPYIVHPMEVMQILTECHCNDDVIIAGILHDTLEDTKTSPADIENKFGLAVLKLVQSESEDKSKTWKERKQTTIDQLKTASAETRIICFADKLSNLRSMKRDLDAIGAQLWDRFNAGVSSIKWYYSTLGEIFKKIEIDGLCDWRQSYDLYNEYETLLDSVFMNT